MIDAERIIEREPAREINQFVAIAPVDGEIKLLHDLIGRFEFKAEEIFTDAFGKIRKLLSGGAEPEL